MSHYFTDNSQLKKNRKEIAFRFLDIDYKLMSDDGVFSKDGLDRGTEAMMKVVSTLEYSGRVCDLGCGIGVVGVILSSLFDLEVVGLDVNQRSVDLANENFARYKVNGKNILSDGLHEKFDHVISNPPIRVGKEKMYSLFDSVYENLNSGGTFVFVIRKQHGALSAQKKAASLFGNCTLLNKDKGFYIYKCHKA